MRTDLMLRAAALLEADAANPEGIKFDLRDWARQGSRAYDMINSSGVPEFVKDQAIPVNCNTAACGLGLMAISGAFKDDGLSYTVTDAGTLIPIFKDPDGGRVSHSFDAGEELFQIEHFASPIEGTSLIYWLFDSGNYEVAEGAVAELEVARRIRQAVTDYSAGLEV